MKRVIQVAVAAAVAVVAWAFWRGASAPTGGAAFGPAEGEPSVAVEAVSAPRAPVHRALGRGSEDSPLPSGPAPPPPTEPAPVAADAAAQSDRIPGEYVLSFYSWRESDAFVRAAREQGIEILDRMALGNAVRVRAGDEALLKRLAAGVSRPSRFDYNYYVRLPPPPSGDDKRAPESGYLGFGPNALPWMGVGFGSPDWGKGVKVAILDTAIQRHPALSETSVSRLEIDGGMNGDSGPGSAHGTAVASIIIGETEGLHGIAPSAEIVGIPVASGDGTGDTFTLARGIVEAVTVGASVINLSLGSYGDSAVLQDAVDYALRNGAAVVASTGNDAVLGVMYPARYDGVIAVGAVDAEYRHVYFSNRGDEVDLTAPGIAVSAAAPNGSVGLFSGTSAAAPVVSGALAALLSENPGMSPPEAADLLMLSADDRGEPGRDEEYGNGVLNLGRAMDRRIE